MSFQTALTQGCSIVQKSGITGTLEYPQIIENNIVLFIILRVRFVHKFLTKTEFLTPLKYGIESLFMLSNLVGIFLQPLF